MNNFHCEKLCDQECCDNLMFALVIQNGRTYNLEQISENRLLKFVANPFNVIELLAKALRIRGIWRTIKCVPRYRSARRFDIEIKLDSNGLDLDSLGEDIHLEVWNGISSRRTRRIITRAQLSKLTLAVMRTPADYESREECETILRGVSN